MKRLLTVCACLVAVAGFADFSAYEDVVRIWAESDRLLALHFHDWRGGPPIQDLKRPDLPFSPENRFAYVELWDKKTGNKLWRKPSTAFSYLWVSPDGKYIVGMSNIMISNPYQLVVFDQTGALLLREHVTSQKAVFTTDELADFWKKYPKAKPRLTPRVKTIDGKHYVDFMVMGMPNALPEGAWEALFDKVVENPEFPWVSESTTNWVWWFDEEPEPKIVEKKGKTYLEFNSAYGPPESKGPVTRTRVQIEIPNQAIASDKK